MKAKTELIKSIIETTPPYTEEELENVKITSFNEQALSKKYYDKQNELIKKLISDSKCTT